MAYDPKSIAKTADLGTYGFNVSAAENAPRGESARRLVVVQFIALLAAAAFIGWAEWERIRLLSDAGSPTSGYVLFVSLQSTPYIIALLLLPLLWFLREPVFGGGLRRACRKWLGADTKPGTQLNTADRVRAGVLALLVGTASLFATRSVGTRQIEIAGDSRSLRSLPPVYHDEFSYLLQAKTFLDGRWSYPRHDRMPELFDTMHVVNQTRYSSRYFPATGAYLAPFVAIDAPYLGYWIAGALISMLIFAAGRELSGNGVGLLAGLLTAVSPGMSVFGNLLLAHHPTLLGLSLFLWTFLVMMRTGSTLPAAVAGIGLSFAMLARPMTAAAFALPFGLVFLGRLRLRDDASKTSLSQIAAMAIPLAGGFAVLVWQNVAVTGEAPTTPYGQFQSTYTPRHVYGFNNVQRAEERIAAGEAGTDRTFEKYDRWATNLTVTHSLVNVADRLLGSWRYALAAVPLIAAGVVFVGCSHRDEPRWWLIAVAIVSMHVAHIPYWLNGVLEFHYVFETIPLWLLCLARSTQILFNTWRERRRSGLMAWWGLLIVAAVTFGRVSVPPLWAKSQSAVGRAVREMGFPKRIYHRFDRFVDETVTDKRALVLVEQDPAQIHLEFVHNHPSLSDDVPILFGRYRKEIDLDAITRKFPDRAIYHVQHRQQSFRLVERRSAPAP